MDSRRLPDRRVRGYVEIIVAALILGTSASTIQLSGMPTGMLLFSRMALAGAVLAIVFVLNGGVEEVRRERCLTRLSLAGCAVALELLCVIIAIRLVNVTVGVALEYMAPIYLAIAAPWLLRTRRSPIVMLAALLALAGMAAIVLPGLAGSAVNPWGLGAGIVAGLGYAVSLLLVKSLGGGVRGTTTALFFCLGSVVVASPLFVWELGQHTYRLTAGDALIVLINGIVYTALCYSLYTNGVRFVPVERAGILSYLEPVSSPLWALLLVGEWPSSATLLGGALIVIAGVLVIAGDRRSATLPIEPIA